MSAAPRRTVLFLRRVRGFTGGHLKVHDYFGHVASSGTHVPRAVFSADTVWDERNPWHAERASAVASFEAARPDALFLGGLDWEFLPPKERARPSVPVVNLVQHVRHGDPKDPRFAYLRHRALRICVSPEVAQAIEGRAEGPVVVIPNGIDLASLPRAAARTSDLVIAALKRPELGRALAARLARPGRTIDLFDGRLPRAAFLARLAAARVALLLPHETEGFYLPAIEAMAMGTLVVCPDCVGNRSFCLDGDTALRPAYEPDALAAAAERALTLEPGARDALAASALAMARRHDLRAERAAFLDLLARLGALVGRP